MVTKLQPHEYIYIYIYIYIFSPLQNQHFVSFNTSALNMDNNLHNPCGGHSPQINTFKSFILTYHAVNLGKDK